jgi:hypothetical protein
MSSLAAVHHRTASNEVLLHLGHLPAASSVTGRVKCFIIESSSLAISCAMKSFRDCSAFVSMPSV